MVNKFMGVTTEAKQIVQLGHDKNNFNRWQGVRRWIDKAGHGYVMTNQEYQKTISYSAENQSSNRYD